MGKPSKKSITLLLALYSLHYENSNVWNVVPKKEIC
jgi:hypothetical protein